jgi:glycosyltransferase involved in cell wall biosynthesis
MTPLISICIPAYKNSDYLSVLLDSIAAQQFREYEVIVTDDSPDDSVENTCKVFETKFPLLYQRNRPAKGSPANWNEGIRLAKGAWIKIMHDDDWFAGADSLGKFAAAANAHPEAGFIFSGYADKESDKVVKVNVLDERIKNKLSRSPLYLFSENYIGNPSTTLVRNDLTEWYDEYLKWVVDFEFYIRCLSQKKLYGIPEVLVNVGLNKEQITKAVFRNAVVEIPENIYLLNKLGEKVLKNIIVYDYYWRIFRNLNIRSIREVEHHAGKNPLPGKIRKMLRFQLKLPLWLLRQGVFSKTFMALSYCSNS